MDVTYALYDLREVLDQTVEMTIYQQATANVETDVQLQILFGEFEKCKEINEYVKEDARHKNMQRAQYLKEKIFENPHYLELKQAERAVNKLRQNIAKQLFGAIDLDIKIDGIEKKAGGCKCEL